MRWHAVIKCDSIKPLRSRLHNRFALVSFAVVVAITTATLIIHGNRESDPDQIIAWIDGFELSARDERVPRNPEIIRHISRFGDVNYYSETQKITFISMAAIRWNDELVLWLLQQGANPNPEEGPLPLHGAVRGKRPSNIIIATILLEHGSDPNRRNPVTGPGDTPLHDAIYFGSAWAIPLLIEFGADPSKTNALGKTPMDYALSVGDTTIIAMLEPYVSE
jgi:hypothetical protein